MNKQNILSSLSYSDCLALIALEKKAHKWAEDSCNFDMPEATETRRHNIIMRDIKRIFGEVPKGFYLNGDPRGAILKIDPEKGGDTEGLQTDWGSYGMLAYTVEEEMKDK